MTGKRSVVAIVDDDPRLRESVEELLESAGYVAQSYSSAGALQQSGLDNVDLVITDIGMPDVDGFDLRDWVRSSRSNLPVFLITGRHEIADQSRARGTAGFFRKPFDGDALLAAIDEALRTEPREHDDGA